MTPRVLFVNHAAVPGGAELVLEDLARGFGDRASVLLLSEGPLVERLRAAGVRVRTAPMPAPLSGTRRGGVPGLGALMALPRLVRAVAEAAREADVVYANSQKAFVIAALAARRARRPLVWHLHDLLTPEHFHPLQRRTVVTLARQRAARIVVNSHATREALARAGGPAARSDVVYCGFDAARLRPLTPGERMAARAGVGMGTGPVIGVVGRLAPWKGQHVVLDALARLPDVTLLVIGAPLFGEDAYADALRAQAAALGLGDRVRFLGHRDDAARLAAALDVVVHSSTAPEPFGRVIVEAMLAARPVIATDAGAAPELLTPGRTGLLVPPGHPVALADAVAGLLAEPGRAEAMGRAAREEAARRFPLTQMLAGVERALALALAA